MGMEMRGPGELNPNGYYEDAYFKRYNELFLMNDLTFQGWLKFIEQLVRERRDLNRPWGFKDPRTADILGLYLAMFEEPKIIWCTRQKELVVKSLIEKAMLTPEKAEATYEARTAMIGRLMTGKDYLHIHFNGELVARASVKEKIQEKWPM